MLYTLKYSGTVTVRAESERGALAEAALRLPHASSLQIIGRQPNQAPATGGKLESVCSWCHPEDQRPGLSHGICASCAAKLVAEVEGKTKP